MKIVIPKGGSHEDWQMLQYKTQHYWEHLLVAIVSNYGMNIFAIFNQKRS
jgi:hypothetical protein